jgi:hypothetical protein
VQGSDKAGISLTLTSNFPFLDAYLMYAECFVRGAGGKATALGYVNAVRTRANGATINAGGLTRFIRRES